MCLDQRIYVIVEFCCFEKISFVAQAGLELLVLLLAPPKGWDYRYLSPQLALIEVFKILKI